MPRLQPAPTMTSKVVPQGQSSRVAKSRNAQAKAAENKAAVDAINGREAARDRAAQACDIGADGSLPPAPMSAKERVDLYDRAKKENTAAKAAQALGQPIPPTPALDELKRRQAMEAKTGKQKSSSSGRVTTERAKKALDTKKRKGKRDPNARKVTDQELLDYITKVRKDHPGDTLVTQRRYAWWVDNLAFSRGRFDAMWTLAEKGVTKAPEAAAKPPRKAAAKKAAPRAATAPKGTEKRTPAAKTPAKKAPAKKSVAKKTTGTPGAGKTVTTHFKESTKKSA